MLAYPHATLCTFLDVCGLLGCGSPRLLFWSNVGGERVSPGALVAGGSREQHSVK